MKCSDTEKLDELPGLRLEENDSFSFCCHPEVSCFNLCCRNLNLFLYPYDVLRLKQRLGISSDTFIEQYSDIVLRPSEFFPEVLLRMSENQEKTCPFLSDKGCSVYADRPDTCRTFPLEQGLLYNAGTRKTKRIYFFRPPDFCQGQHEKQTWTAETWIRDQEAEMHNSMTARWAEVKRLFQRDPWGGQGPYSPRGKMAFMAAYNIDRFREFVFESSFLKRYNVKTEILKKAEKDDTDLLKLGLEWMKFFLWGIKSECLKVNR